MPQINTFNHCLCTAIAEKVIPAYMKLYAFIKDVYIPKCHQ